MESDLSTINQFLADFPFEVLARTSEDLDDDFRSQLEELAAGGFPEDGRDELARDVLSNPEALDYLAELALRRQDDGAAAE